MTEFTGEVHPFADRFPMLTDEELADLADDIKANGQLHPILLSPEGVLLDGRNRLRACELAGVPAKFETYEGNPVALIVSANVRRRQMTAAQTAMAAAVGLAEEGKRVNGKWVYGASAQTVRDLTVSKDSLQRCGVILDYDQERRTTFADSVLTGLPLDEAYKNVMIARRAEQDATDAAERERVATQERDAAARAAFDELRAGAPDLAELVRADKLTLDDARAAWDNRRREEIAARTTDLNEWVRLSDTITESLSRAVDRQRIPTDLPQQYPQPADLLARVSRLIDRLKEISE